MLQPPTDNLYKFLAIAGLIIFGFSVYIPLQKLEDYSLAVAKWSGEWMPLVERASNQADVARDELDCAIKAAEGTLNNGIKKLCDEVEARGEANRQITSDLNQAIAELQGGKELLGHLGREYIHYRNIGIVAGIVGFLSCIAGFYLWYVRVQRPLDQRNKEILDGGRETDD